MIFSTLFGVVRWSVHFVNVQRSQLGDEHVCIIRIYACIYVHIYINICMCVCVFGVCVVWCVCVCVYVCECVCVAGFMQRHRLQRNPPAVSVCPHSSCPIYLPG